MATRSRSRKPAPDTRESEAVAASGVAPDAGEGAAPTHAADPAPAIETGPDTEAPVEAPIEAPVEAPVEAPTPAPEPQDVVTATLETAVPTMTHVHVTAKHDGFRRCGRAWPASGVQVSVEDLTDAAIGRLLAEPELVVVPVFGPAREID